MSLNRNPPRGGRRRPAGAGPALALAAASLVLAACGRIDFFGPVECVLEHVPEGQIGQPGRRMSVEWGWFMDDPFVELAGFTHIAGDGQTARVEVSEAGFFAVTLQDVMVLEGEPETPVRWTSADFWRLDAAPARAAPARLHHWGRRIAPANSEAAAKARAGQWEAASPWEAPSPSAAPAPLDAQVWRCAP